MLAHYIARIMQFSSRDLEQRQSWLHLYTAPDRIRDNIRAIEDYLAEAETLIKDGGELQVMLKEKSVQPPSVTAPASHASSSAVKVEAIVNTP
jgi:polyphosphate kinase